MTEVVDSAKVWGLLFLVLDMPVLYCYIFALESAFSLANMSTGCCMQLDDEEDELEMALAEQRAMTVAASVKPSAGVVAAGASARNALSPAVLAQRPLLRVSSRMTIEDRVPSLNTMPGESPDMRGDIAT